MHQSYIDSNNTKLPVQTVSINELKEAFFSLNPIKVLMMTYVTKVIRRCFDELGTPLQHIFDLSLSQDISPNKLKLAKVAPIYKN